jgi:putative ABC transport system ATP-binding protein
MAIVSAEGISRDFRIESGVVHALSDVSLEVATGTLSVLRGRSGSGKTTLLNVLAGLDLPDRGHVVFDGTDLGGLSEAARDGLRRRSVGFVFQSLALLAVMSAYENVEFGLRIAGYPAGRRRARAEECLGLVGLRRRMDHRPHELSGGEQQRVAIARAIAHEPRVVYADEPTGELDSHTGIGVVKLFRELVERTGLTVVMSTHDPNMTELADRVFSLEDGRIVDG